MLALPADLGKAQSAMRKSLQREPSYPSEPGVDAELGFSRGGRVVGGILAALDALVCWLSPKPRPRRFVRVPDFRGMMMTKAWFPAVQAGVKLRVHRLNEHPAPVDGLVVDQQPPVGTRVRSGSKVTLDVLHPDDAPWNLSISSPD